MEPATKEDLRELKTDLVKLMDVKFEAVSAKFETVSAKFETVATKEELVILKSRMFKWGLSLVISNVSIAIAISFAACLTKNCWDNPWLFNHNASILP